MNFVERNEILMDDEFTAKVRIALCDWINYWAINGTASITDPDLKAMTDTFIQSALGNLEAYVKRIAILIISEGVVKEAQTVTDAIVQTALTTVMSNAISYFL